MRAYRRAGLAPVESLHTGMLIIYGARDIINLKNLNLTTRDIGRISDEEILFRSIMED